MQNPAADSAPAHPLLIWRRDRRMSLATLAAKAGITAASASRIEHRLQVPSPALIRKLARVTGIAAAAFLPAADDDAS